MKQSSSTSAGKQASKVTMKQSSSTSAGKQASTATLKQGSSTSATSQDKSGQNKLKRKASGPQSADTLPSKRPLLQPIAGTKDRPCIQESRLARIHRLMISPQTKLYCHFLQYSNKIFDSINLLLQREEPCLHILHRKLMDTYRDLLLRFVKPECIAASSHDVKDVSYGNENQRSDKDLMIGTEAKEYIKSMTTDEGDVSLQLTKVDLDYFYLSVRKYYESACGYALKTWPFDVKFLQEAEVLDINLRRKVSFSSLHHFVARYPCILGNSSTSTVDDLQIEFAQYQVENFEDHPEVLDTKLRIDKKWNVISDMKDGNGCRRFPLLCRVMKALLVVPHSNDACERVFSIVRKNKTDFRGSMTLDTLQSLLTEKIANTLPCHKRQFSQESLRDFKQATYKSLKGQASSSSATSTAPPPSGQ